MTYRLLAILLTIATAAPVFADAPPAKPPQTICSTEGHACATRAVDGRSATVWRRGRGGARMTAWQAKVSSPALIVPDDGRSLVEFYPGPNLLDRKAGPRTPVITFHRPGAIPVVIPLGAVIADIARLPATVSHRQWARTFGFDGPDFVLQTAEGRTIRFDPATGRRR